jgi:hypothetical protein
MGLKSILLVVLLLFVTSLIYPGSRSVQPNNDSSSIENTFKISIQQIYESLNDSSLNPEAFQIAMLGYRSLTSKGLVLKDSLLTIIDYSRPSSVSRFYVIDLRQQHVIFKTLVAHGLNSGELYATRYSNKAQSKQSALGFYITGNPYKGGQGYSLLLSGVDTGYNDNARMRSIVIHGASYVTRKYVDSCGRLGRSFGCPALPPDKNDAIIELIKDGSLLFSYYPDIDYLTRSKVLAYLPREFITITSSL